MWQSMPIPPPASYAFGLLTNNTITGYYSTAERIANFIQTFPLASFSQAVYPRLNRIFIKNRMRSIKIMHEIQNLTTLGFLISLPIAYLVSPFIVRIICGMPYQEVVITLRLLLVSIIFVGANAFKVQFLLICGRADLYSKLHVVAALVGLPLIFLLLYSLSYPGAALSAIITEAGIFFATTLLLKRVI